jgi:hypothetical protein
MANSDAVSVAAPSAWARRAKSAPLPTLCLLGYQHQIVRSSAEVGENLLPLANRVASLLKRWLLGTHQGATSVAHLDYYLDEYTFRFNRRTSGSRGLLFLRLIQQAVDLSPVPANEIRGGRRPMENQPVDVT